MDTMLILAIAAITLALVLYTVGVFMERVQKTLKLHHVILFWCGLVCDTTGTTLMSFIARGNGTQGLGVHGITGALAIALMLVHAVWAVVVLARKQDKARAVFHRFSIIVWAVWLVPFVIGMFMGMA